MKSYNGFSAEQRMAAFNWLKAEVAAGRRTMTKPKCDACEQARGYLMAHSEDYSSPFGDNIGRWTFCYWCHMLLHCRLRAPDRFDAYRVMLVSGVRFVNPHGPNWGGVQRYLQGAAPAREPIGHVLAVDPFVPVFAEGRRAARPFELRAK